MNNRLHLRTPEAAAYLGLSRSTMEKMRLSGNGPRYAKFSRLVIYAVSDLDDWVGSHKRLSTIEISDLQPHHTSSPSRLS